MMSEYLKYLFLLILSIDAWAYPRRCLLNMNEDMVKCISENLRLNGMNRFFLTGSDAPTCNDGSPAGYYYRENPESTEWVIYLEGGWFCSDPQTCSNRKAQNSFSTVMSSNSWKPKKLGDGILSVDQTENSEFYQANHVYIPYCSSDFWVGNTIADGIDGTKLAFHGSRIISDVVVDLLGKGLKDATRLIMSGSSAGGIGVLQNIDRISKFLSRNANTKIDIRGLVDSAWVLDVATDEDCDECNPDLIFKKAVKYWGASLHSKCSSTFKKMYKHKCLFASNTIKFLKRPIFVFQWLLDTVQILTENSYHFNLNEDYIKDLGRRMTKSLNKSITDQKHAIYSPTCASHTGLATTTSLYSINIKGSTLNQALKCWLSDNNCKKRFLDSCTGLRCHGNRCPSITHPLTGEIITRPRGEKERRNSLTEGMTDSAKHYLEIFKGLQMFGGNSETEKV